jgi:ABC-2 type transport system ATP-binding protein
MTAVQQPRGPVVRVTGLSVDRGGRSVMSDLSLTVPAGEVTGLLGPSGSGKTTLIRAMVGVQQVKAGTVEVLDEPAGSRGLRERVSYVTQSPSVYPDLSVHSNVHFFAKILGADKSDVERVIGEVDLAEQKSQLVGRLSGGQRSRVSLAVALLGSPELLVLDEPTVGLDPLLRRDLWALFHRLADGGVSLLVSSHVMDEASRCDGLLMLREGQLLAQGTLESLLNQTRTQTVEDAFLALVEGTDP